MPRPTVIVATTSLAMAYALDKLLDQPCRKLGLKLEICPEGGNLDTGLKTQAYYSAEELFDCLSARTPIALADTLVVLDVGVELEQAFQPAAQQADIGWHVTKQKRAGVAVELILRFPQIFPVFLSPAVPMEECEAAKQSSGMIAPVTRDITSDGYQIFFKLRESLGIKHRTTLTKELINCLDHIQALRVPLHFISPLDHGRGLESTIARFARGMRCWFDPTGLRTLVKNYFLGTLFGSANDWSNTWPNDGDTSQQQGGLRDILLERLDHVAVTVDEEREFAMLNAYSAYKFGRRAWMVTTYGEFNDQSLWPEGDKQASPQMDVVVLRDIDLRFPDIPEGKKIRADLANIDADVWENKLGDDWCVRAVSSRPSVEIPEKDFGLDNDKDVHRLLGQYTDSSKKCHYLGLPKPISTLYDLIELVKKKDGNEPQTVMPRLKNWGQHFFQPRPGQTIISRLKTVKDTTGGGGHGAPYLNLAIAESLLQQAGNCEKGPVENIIGALLASEAYELLLGMSKTTALEALMMLHKKEVTAEAGFPGISGNMKISQRRADIDNSLDLLFEQDESINPKEARKTRNMFLSRFWADLRPVYRDAELFEPAEAANRESLIYTQWISFVSLAQALGCKGVLVTGIKRLLVRVATGICPMSIAAFVMWFFLTPLYAMSGERSWNPSWEGIGNFLILFRDVALTSLALQNTNLPTGNWGGLLLFLHIGLSYLLFGLFVSIFHRKITRG